MTRIDPAVTIYHGAVIAITVGTFLTAGLGVALITFGVFQIGLAIVMGLNEHDRADNKDRHGR